MTDTTIKSLSFADFDDELRTVSVVAASGGEEGTLHVQTVDSKFRGDLGCWILDEEGYESVDPDDWLSLDLDVVIGAAEKFLASKTVITRVGDNHGLYVRAINDARFEVVEENPNFISAEASQSMEQYRFIAVFGSGVEAHNFVSGLAA